MKISKNNKQSILKGVLTLSLMLVSIISFASCSKDNGTPREDAPPVVLVHGAWQGAYAWDKIKTNLMAEGHEVRVVALAGHGDDNTPVTELTFEGYVNQVKEAVHSFDKPVILVGHSLGGALITQTAAELPQKISKLVYVAGFIPESGKSVLDYSAMDEGSLLSGVLEFSEDHSLAGLVNPEVNLPNVFCQDGTNEQKQFLLAHYKAEPVAPLATPLNYELGNYNAAGKKYYIFTTIDNAISYSFQQQMASDAGITNIYDIETGHSPFISKPAELTAILEAIANE